MSTSSNVDLAGLNEKQSQAMAGSEVAEGRNVLAEQSELRKKILLVIFCFAQFLDTFNNSALFAAIPPISAAIGISNSDSVWLISAYQLTFAAFLLVCGRLSDLYNPKYVFILGAAGMGFLALGAGFVRHQVALIILRALMGIGAALTIPSALHMIVHLFPDPAVQANAMAAFAGSGAIGNVIGLVIGALLVTLASWPWVFYFIAIVGVMIAVSVLILVPSQGSRHISTGDKATRFKRLDLPGVGILTVSLILFIFAVTSGSINGWGSARVIAPLVISVVLVVAFIVIEASLPEDYAALPPKMWFYENFSILIAAALLPFMWWGAVQLLFSWLWQEVYGWTALKTAVHFLPIGLFSFPFMAASVFLQQTIPLKYVILIGEVMALVGTVLLPFANSEDRYWRFAFPGFCLGTAGVTITFATVNIAVFASTPPKVAGMVGAIFSCALQVGCAAGAAIITSIQTSVQQNHGGPNGFTGRAAGFWFLFAVVCTLTLSVLVFMRNTLPPVKKQKIGDSDGEGAFSSDASTLGSPGLQKTPNSTMVTTLSPEL